MFVAGAVELSPKGHPRRIRLAMIADFSAATLRPFVAATAATGARVVTELMRWMPPPDGISHSMMVG